MPAAYLFDLDGTLYQNNAAIPGALDLIGRLKALGTPCRFLTNTTSKPRSAIVARLRSYGFPVESHEVFTALVAGADLARSLGYRTVLPLVNRAALEDLEGLELIGGTASGRSADLVPGRPADAVIVGDLAETWTFDLLQQAFTALLAGAGLIALSRDRYWMTPAGLTLDAGPFVAALEYATEMESHLAGKPSSAFYRGAVQSLELPAETGGSDIVMVGDDVHGDIEGAQRAGYRGYLVKTGKYREEVATRSKVTPDRILESVADLLSAII